MLIKLFFLFTIAIITVKSQQIDGLTIGADVAKWIYIYNSSLVQALYKPMSERFKAQCGIIFECCPNQRADFINLMSKDSFKQTCYGNHAEQSSKSRSSKCNTYIQELENVKKSIEYVNMIKTINDMSGIDTRLQNWRTQMTRLCSRDEVEAYYCQPTDLIKFQNCQEKVLSWLAEEDNGKNYATFVRQWENIYTTYVRQLVKAFFELHG